jgi:hypothetical protein
MNKFKMLVLTALAAATVGTGALAAAPSASAQAMWGDGELPQGHACILHTNLGNITYPHLSLITVDGSDGKKHTYMCNDGNWVEVKTLTAPTATFTGSLSGVLTRV